eukprot:6459789-Amphidinium_carterae.1
MFDATFCHGRPPVRALRRVATSETLLSQPAELWDFLIKQSLLILQIFLGNLVASEEDMAASRAIPRKT